MDPVERLVEGVAFAHLEYDGRPAIGVGFSTLGWGGASFLTTNERGEPFGAHDDEMGAGEPEWDRLSGFEHVEDDTVLEWTHEGARMVVAGFGRLNAHILTSALLRADPDSFGRPGHLDRVRRLRILLTGRFRREAEAAGFDARFLDGMDAVEGMSEPGTVLVQRMFADTAEAGVMRRWGRDYPFVMDVLAHEVDFPALARAGDDLPAGLAAARPGVGRASVRALRGLRRETMGGGAGLRRTEAAALLLRLLGDLEPSRMPRDSASAESMLRCALAADRVALGTGLDPGRLLASAKADWAAFERRCAEASGGQAASAAAHVSDVAAHLADVLVLPLAARDRGSDEIVSPAREVAVGRAARLLFSGKSLPAVLGTSARWHGRFEALRLALPRAARPERREADAEPGAPFERNGLRVVRLLDEKALADEGRDGPDGAGVEGLSHCVARYAADARERVFHFVGVRRAGPGGERLSTARIAVPREGARGRVAEHRGRANADPPPEAVAALEAFLDEVRLSPTVPPGAAKGVAALCGYDWRDDEAVRQAVRAYAAFLPRWTRGLDLPALASRVLGDGVG